MKSADSSEPKLVMSPNERAVLKELRGHEPIFHRSEGGGSSEAAARMMAKDFWEVGASGRRYDRAYVLETLTARDESPVEDEWETQDFHCRELSADVYLLTYTLLQGERKTRRTTIWQRNGTSWKIVFHQGTVVQA
jgi:hypothetical protein